MALPHETIAILGTGSFAPLRVVTNDELAKTVDTTDEWIRTRTGIHERHIGKPDEATSDFAVNAARAALADAGLQASDLDLIIVATLTPDLPMPACATFVQAKLGARPTIPCFDLNAACTGFIYALDTAWAMVSSGRYRHALIVGAEKLSTILDWQDRATCVLFGDGAGAAIIGPIKDKPAGQNQPASDTSSRAILGVKLYARSNPDLLYIPAGGSLRPATTETLATKGHYVKMKGREVFKIAVREMSQAAREILEQHGLSIDQIDCVIPHQANQRIIDAIADSLKVPHERLFINLDRYGNTSAASIPIALDEARRAGRIRQGQTTLIVAFGAGLTYGAALLRW